MSPGFKLKARYKFEDEHIKQFVKISISNLDHLKNTKNGYDCQYGKRYCE